MKITKITVHNFLKLKDIEMNPSQTNVIVGKNKQGKTSILKAIRAAFTGDADSTSIRIGEGKAEITVEMEDLNIKRTFTPSGTKVNVTNKEGLEYPAPQKYLNGILGTFSFNPIEFFDKKASERKKYLLNAIKLTLNQDELAAYTGEKLAGIDYEAHALDVVEMARKFYYDKRTAANAEVNKKIKSLEDLTASIPEGFDPKSVDESKIISIREAIQKDKSEKQKHASHEIRIRDFQNQEADLVGQIANLQKKLEAIQAEIVQALDVKFEYSDDMTIAAAEETLAKLESQRELVFTAKRADEVRSELNDATMDASKLDVIVKKLTKEVPEDLISKAKLPVEGLSISGDDILINGVNIDNLSSSEQLKFGLQIVRSLNGNFKVICVDGIETLDKESFEFFLKEVENDDYQYFVTRVDGTHEHSITIEDGEIVPSATQA
jgi:hypothetical protein